MHILLHDYSGHPFQFELSQELGRRGHRVTHSHNESYVSGKGRLREEGVEGLDVVSLRMSSAFAKYDVTTRLRQELTYALTLLRHVRETSPDLVVVCNVPLLAHFVFSRLQRRVPMVFWQQDVYSQAIGREAVRRLGALGRLIATLADRAERDIVRRAHSCVAIAKTFLPVHDRWGTAQKVTVIPNWAPVAEITPRAKDNAWSRRESLHDRPVLLYSGTLGLKHNPALLVKLAEEVRRSVPDVVLAVVSVGDGADYVREVAPADATVVLPFQPFEELPDALAAADVLVTLLEPHASAYSVPSKTLTYLCAGRPIVAMLAADNPAAELVQAAAGVVVDPDDDGVAEAAAAVVELLGDPARAARVGAQSRTLAEEQFAIARIAGQFEAVLAGAMAAHRVIPAPSPSRAEVEDR